MEGTIILTPQLVSSDISLTSEAMEATSVMVLSRDLSGDPSLELTDTLKVGGGVAPGEEP